jgi:hypothetical protein
MTLSFFFFFTFTIIVQILDLVTLLQVLQNIIFTSLQKSFYEYFPAGLIFYNFLLSPITAHCHMLSPLSSTVLYWTCLGLHFLFCHYFILLWTKRCPTHKTHFRWHESSLISSSSFQYFTLMWLWSNKCLINLHVSYSW